MYGERVGMGGLLSHLSRAKQSASKVGHPSAAEYKGKSNSNSKVNCPIQSEGWLEWATRDF